MAKQNGILPFSGKLGEVVGYRRGKQHFSRLVATKHQLSEESSKSAAEFGKGSAAAAMVRAAFRPRLSELYREHLHHRLANAFRLVIRSGPASLKGQREVWDGDLALLKGFELNKHCRTGRHCMAGFSISLEGGQLLLSLPPMAWGTTIFGPARAGSIVLYFSCGSFDFKQRLQHSSHAAPLHIAKGTSLPALSLYFPVPELPEQSLIFLVSFHFMDDQQQVIQNQRCQAGCIFEAFHLHHGERKPFIPEEEAPLRPADPPVPEEEEIQWLRRPEQ